jgi:DNA-binding helix-hairpin-helix protein with protein kinase domain
VAPSNITTDMILPELALPAAERQADAVEVEAVTYNGNTNADDTNVTKETNVSAPVQAIVDAEPVHPKLAPLPSTSIDFNALKAKGTRTIPANTILKEATW